MDRRVKREGDIVLCKEFKNAKPETPNGSKTMLQILQNCCKETPDAPFLGTIVDDRVVYKTYADVMGQVSKLAAFLEKITEEDSIVGIYAVNRMEWVVAEYASYLAKCCNCPLYSTFPPSALKAIINETGLKVLVASADKAKSLLENVLAEETFKIKHIVLMDADDSLAARYKERGVNVCSLQSVLDGEHVPVSRKEPVASDIATICYTSGTTGMPKGALLTHENFLSIISAFVKNKNPKDIVVFTKDDVYISYLPLPHVLERLCFSLAVASKTKIAFFRGNPKLLQADMKIIKPTFIVTVPRVLNIFMEKIRASVAQKSFIVRGLFNIGLKFKIWRQKHGVYKSWLLDKLIFGKVAREFGGEIKTSLCGGASLSPNVLQFIEATLSIKIFQGYGQTEGLAANILLPMDVNNDLSVGIPFPSTEVRLAPVEGYAPEHDGQRVGEIQMRGKSITQGYYKRPEETKAAFTEDGFLRTGDIAREENGFYYIVGRVKEIFKTSFGEYIVPEKVENLLAGGVIEDVFVTNSKFSDYLLAIVVCTDSSLKREEIIEIINARANRQVSEKRLTRFEVPTHFIIIDQPFASYADGTLITPSMKKRRNSIAEHFKNQISEAFDHSG